MLSLPLAALLVISTSANAWTGSAQAIETLAARTEKAAKEKSPLAIGLLYGMWNMNRLIDQPERVERALSTIISIPKVDPLLSAHASFLLSSLAMKRGDLEGAKKRIEEVGLVKRAMILGPFENSAAQGHDEIFPPETAIALEETVPGKGHALKWREIEELSQYGVFELSSLLYPPTEGTAYVMVALEANADTAIALRTGSIDQLKVYLNGKEMYALDTRRGPALDQDAIPLLVPRGLSVLMLKSSWTANAGRILFRLTKPDGAKLANVTVHGDRGMITRALADMKASGAAKATHKVVAVGDALDRHVARSKGDALAEALATRADLRAILGLYDRRKLPIPPESDLEAAIAINKNDPMMRFFYAHRVEERDPALAHETLEAALAADKNHVPTLYKLGSNALAGGRTLEARARLEQAIAADPTFAPAVLALASLRFDRGADRELALFELGLAAEKMKSAAIWAELARMRRASDDRTGAREAAEHALELEQMDLETRGLLINLLTGANQMPRALETLDRAIALEPYNLEHRLKKALALAANEATMNEAFTVVAETERLFPDAPQAAATRAELFLWKGDDKAALAALDRALELDPFQPELRRHQASLTRLKDQLEDLYSVDANELAKSAVSAEEKSNGAIYLADRTVIRLYENGQSSRFQQMVLRLRNSTLKDALRVHRLPYSPSREYMEVLTAERIRPSGEVIKASSVNDSGDGGKVGGMYVDQRVKSIVFDDLAEGDVINIRYRTESLGPNMFGTFFGDVAPLQDRLPKQNVLYTVLSPKSRPIYYGEVRAAKPKIEDDGRTVKHTWSLDQVPGLDEETFQPPYPDIGMMVNVSTYERWEDLGRWYAGLFADQMELDAVARAAGKKVVAGAKDDAEKIQRLYEYVIKNTRYVGIELGIHGWKPFKASEVHRRRYGDCKDKATLLAALLRDNGIDATIALVRTADRGMLAPAPATMWAFNHAITYVPSLDLFLDGTAEFSGSRELPWMDQGGMALIVHPDGRTRLTALPDSTPDDNLNRSSYVAEISREGALKLKGREEFFGARASQLRQEFEEVDQRRPRLEKQLNQVFNGVHVVSLEFSDLSALEKPVHYDYVAQIERYGVEEGNRFVIPLTLFEHQVASAYATLATRKYDLVSNHAWSTQNVVRYQLPPGSKLESLPEGVKLDSKYMSLVQTVREVPGGFETDDVVTMKSKRIPLEDYQELRNACLAIDRALGRSVVIRW
jgi:transglutaminase-like putative cysteine protease/tetratricopeptide (TPR) repeat protein